MILFLQRSMVESDSYPLWLGGVSSAIEGEDSTILSVPVDAVSTSSGMRFSGMTSNVESFAGDWGKSPSSGMMSIPSESLSCNIL